VAARIGVGLIAALVLAWLGIAERNVRLEAEGVAAAGNLRVPGNFARAEADLRAARFLNPDPGPDLNRAILYQGAGRRSAAEAVLRDVLRGEPDNVLAWGLLYGASGDPDSATAREALAALRRLDPVSARRR
jgi:predicted Zn-dependent protease